MDIILDKLMALTSPVPSPWREEALERQANMAEIEKAGEIALRFLVKMDKKGISTHRLALMSGLDEEVVERVLEGTSLPDPTVVVRIEEVLRKPRMAVSSRPRQVSVVQEAIAVYRPSGCRRSRKRMKTAQSRMKRIAKEGNKGLVAFRRGV